MSSSSSTSEIAIFFRKKRIGFNSIEMVFNAILPSLPGNYDVYPLPEAGTSPRAIFRNLWFVFKHRHKVNHITGDCLYAGLLLPLRSRLILTIHDLQSLFANKKGLRKWLCYLLWVLLPSLRANCITAISEETKKEIRQVTIGTARKIRVIYNPVDPCFQPSKKRIDSSVPVILHIGTKKNKNLERVIAALQGVPCVLEILGKLQNEQKILLEQSGIVWKSFCDLPKEEVVKLYQSCDLISFPSLYEGFGMPLIEGQACKKPVLASDISICHEVAGEGAYFADPQDWRKIRAGFLWLIHNKALRNRLIRAGEINLSRFDCTVIARQYWEIYQKLL